MLVSKSVRNSTVVALLVLGAAACSEGPTSPVRLSPEAEPLLAKGGKSGGGSGSPGKDEGTRTFTIWPGAGVLEKFGDHVLSIPANVVCDPDKSPYGAAYWDKPCPRANAPIQVTAKWTTHSSRPVISFSPDLRFAPSKNQNQWVTLSLRAPKGIDPELYYAILWFDRDAGRWVDESEADPTLKARTGKGGNMVTRRLKHFSIWALWAGFGSYNVTSGMDDAFGGMGGW
jgi:hypothetical protein